MASTRRNHAASPSTEYVKKNCDAPWTSRTPCSGVPVCSCEAAVIPVTTDAIADPRNATYRATTTRRVVSSVIATIPMRSASATGTPMAGLNGIIQPSSTRNCSREKLRRL